MRFLQTIATAGFIAAMAVCARRRCGYFRRRRDLPLSDLRQMGRRLQERDRHRPELPVDRLRRRHQADQGQDRDLRRHRRAAEGRGARQGRPRPVPDGDGRHRAGRQPRRHQAGRTRARRPDARQDLPRRDQDLGRPGDQEAQPERQAAVAGDRRRASLGRLGHDLQLHLLPRRSRARTGSRRSASTRRSNGRSASAPRATRASPTTSPRPRARSATSSTPMPSRTS